MARRSTVACRRICTADVVNSPAMMPATIRSGQPVAVPQTPSAATLPIASLREHKPPVSAFPRVCA